MPRSRVNNLSAERILARDGPVLQRALRRVESDQKTLNRLSESARELTRRKTLVPRIHYQSDLPICSVLPEVVGALKKHQVIVVAGQTGSGKTTQLPLACLKADLGTRGMICHTQPRRLAARSVADRLAQQLNTGVGDKVGFAVRFEDQVSRNTLVKVMTDGLLLTEIRRDRSLYDYDTVIVDEAHERSLNIDFLLGYLKHLLVRRTDLRVIVTSATIDVQAFSSFFNDAPVFVAEGRSFPIETRYKPIEDEVEDVLIDCLEEIQAEPISKVQDILVFLPGEREIFNWAHWFRKQFANRFEVLPLYARLPASEQRKIFSTSSKRRILLATNVAETSLTVPNIRYVIDFGQARISRFSLRSRIQRLPIEAISQASANQRAGRCGRLAPGVCFRLYSEADYLSREAFTDPEIMRTNLAAVVLQMVVFGFGEIATFPFLNRPDDRAVASAKRLLHELGALQNDNVTDLGRQMVQIPVDPRLARMLIEANQQKALKELLVIVSALAVQEPFLRPLEQQQAADEVHRQFRHPKSDFLSYLNLWEWIEGLREDHSRNQLRRILERHFVSTQRYLEWRALHRQLVLTCKRLRMSINKKVASFERVHKSILSGSLSFLGLRLEDSSYQGARNLKFSLFPGSSIANRKPKWVVAATIVETSRVYARGLAEINPKWIETFSRSVMKTRVHDHFWDTTQNDSCTYLDVSVYGLPVVQNRSVKLKDYDRDAARELFLTHALVHNQANVDIREVRANFKLRESLLETQSKERRTDIVLSVDSVVELYRRKVPDEVCDRVSFIRWYRTADAKQRSGLLIQREEFLHVPDHSVRDQAYPAELKINSVCFALRYKFGPGRDDDGVSIRVPLADLSKLQQSSLDWIVPGFFEEKCTELLRHLPKQYRKQLAPIPDKIKELVPLLLQDGHYRVGHLAEVLSQRVLALFQVEIAATVWSVEDVSKHLIVNVQVVDQQQKVIAQGRNLADLRQRVQHLLEDRFDDSFKAPYEQKGLKTFPLAGFPRSITAKSPSGTIELFPVLVDRGDGVDIRVGFDEREQYHGSIRGMCRLALIREHQTITYLTTQFKNDRSLQLYSTSLGNLANFRQLLFLTAARNTFFSSPPLPDTDKKFQQTIENNRRHFIPNALRLMDSVSSALAMRHQLMLRVASLEKPILQESREDIEQQLDSLFDSDFPFSFSVERMPDLPRYLNGIKARLDRLSGKLSKDLLATREIARWQDRLVALSVQRQHPYADGLFHLLQEYRLSLFCQEIKTRMKLSPQRLEQAFAQLEHQN
ncbi:MAG: ATP-dependent RNA helicase HrpA [Gammaproteobacteria bacterium]|nr:ATP-dependent RNA helicase HrpA [Gammaproteobacteria bacterium]